MLPKPGQSVDVIVTQLNSLANQATHFSNDNIAAYVQWVHVLEISLGNLFIDVPFDRLYSERFWQLTRTQPPPVQWQEMISLERDRLVAWLKELLGRVNERAGQFAGATGAVGVLDTNAFLHRLPPSEVEWDALLGSPAELVVPLRVVHELDDKKAANSKPLRVRASKRLRQLADYTFGDEPHEIRAGVRIAIVRSLDLDSEAERRPRVPAADVEILDFCEALATYTGSRPVYLVTGDLSMRVQAAARSVRVMPLPEETELPLDAADPGE